MLRNLELVGVSGLTFRVQTSSKRSVRGWYRRDPVLVASPDGVGDVGVGSWRGPSGPVQLCL